MKPGGPAPRAAGAGRSRYEARGRGSGRTGSLAETHDLLLEAHTWEHETPPIACLGFTFTVRTDSAPLGRLVSELFAACRTDSAPDHRFSIRSHPVAVGRRFTLYLDGRRCDATTAPELVLPLLAWHVNRQVVASSGDRLLVHAAAARRGDDLVVLAGDSGAGKSTLVAALSVRGLEYLSDEIVAIDPASLRVDAYPKPIALEPGSWSSLESLRPATDPASLPFFTRTWMVAPRASGHDVPRDGGRAAGGSGGSLIVFPTYRPGASDTLVPISRAETVVRLAGLAFNLSRWGPAGIDALADLAGDAGCYRLEFADVDLACAAIEQAHEQRRRRAATGDAGQGSAAAPGSRADAGMLDLHTRTLDGETVVWDAGNGSVHHLNATATLVMDAARECSGASEVTALVAQRAQLTEDEIRPDVESVLADLAALGLVDATTARA